MIDRTFPAQDSTLSADALAQMLPGEYALPGPLRCRLFRKGICDTYRVFASDRLFYLKVYRHGRRERLDVVEEVRLLKHLEADGVSVARPIARRGGEYVIALAAPEGPRYAVLFESAPGAPGDAGDDQRIRAFGHLVGRMHQSLDTLPLPYRRTPLDLTHLIDENMAAIRPFMDHRPQDLAVIEAIAEECRRLPVFGSRDTPVFGPCHGDLHGGDVCYDDHGNPTLFDFDSSGCGWRALDIGVFLASHDWMDTSAEAESRRQRRLSVFLDGYRCIRALTADELVAVQHTPPIRHIFLMGFVLRYTTVREGDHWADDRFIDWHLNWFRFWAKTRE